MKTCIKKFSVLQTGKILSLLYGFLSIIMLPFVLILGSKAENGSSMVMMLLLYPILGFLGGMIMASLYNLSANWIGGLEVTIEEIQEKEIP